MFFFFFLNKKDREKVEKMCDQFKIQAIFDKKIESKLRTGDIIVMDNTPDSADQDEEILNSISEYSGDATFITCSGRYVNNVVYYAIADSYVNFSLLDSEARSELSKIKFSLSNVRRRMGLNDNQ